LKVNPARVKKFLRRHKSFEFGSNVHHYAQVRDRNHAAVENLSACGYRLRNCVLVDELLHWRVDRLISCLLNCFRSLFWRRFVRYVARRLARLFGILGQICRFIG